MTSHFRIGTCHSGTERQAYIRRQEWFGAKYYIKQVVGWAPVNAILLPLWRFVTLRAPEYRWRFPVNREVVEAQVNGVTFRLLNPMRCSIAKELFWSRGRRRVAADRFALDLFCQLAKRADIALDIGANTGLFSIAAAAVNPELEVHAYEIVPEVVLQLITNLIRNDILCRVHVHSYGLGASKTEMRIPASTRSSALPSAFSSKLHFSNGARVSFRTLDREMRFMPQQACVLLKVDVEGTENDLFNSGYEFTARFGPDILCEILPGECNLPEVRQYVQVNLYHTYKITDDKLQLLPELVPDYTYHDWLLTRATQEELAARIFPLKVG